MFFNEFYFDLDSKKETLLNLMIYNNSNISYLTYCHLFKISFEYYLI